jgi:hypothetical protein
MKKSPAGKNSKKRNTRKGKASLLIVFVFAVIVCLLTTMVVVMQVSAGYLDWLPIPLHSLLVADYSADPHDFKVAAVKFDLILEAIRDSIEYGSSDDSYERFATLQAGLSSPVPSVTPDYSQTPFTSTPEQPTATPENTYRPPTPSPTTLPTQTSTVEPTQLLPSPTYIIWPTATNRPYIPNPTQPPPPPPTNPPPTNPPPPPTDPPPPPPTNPPPPPPTNPPPPPNPYPPAYP